MMFWWDCSSSLYPVCTGVWEGVCEGTCHPGSSWAVLTAELSVQGPPSKPSGGECQPTTASEVFAVTVLKTSLSSLNLVPAPAGSCKEPLGRFSAFSSFFISAGSCCFVVASNFFWAVSLILSLHSQASLLCGLSSILLPEVGSSLLVDYFVVILNFLEGCGM